MSRYLLAVTVGPVQDFIATARRTRDFWYGSHLLSEISKAVARSLNASCELMIFPAPENPATDLKQESELNVVNVILALTADGKRPKHVAEQARQAAQDEWLASARGALEELKKLGGGDLVDEDRFKVQIADVIEFYAVWVGYDPASDEYPKKRQRLMRLLAGDKSCRAFAPAPDTPVGILKSSLDGSRETLFKTKFKREELPKELQRRWRLGEGEQLDAVGLTKRLGGGNRGYPSVSRIAVDPWTRGNESRLEDVRVACEELRSEFGLAKVSVGQFSAFPYEGQILYRSRLAALVGEWQMNRTDFWYLEEYLKEVGSEPDPYLVVLAADGDRMGAAISGIKTPEDHQAFSRALSKFAGAASQLIAKHQGSLVYAGGDDVLAFLPLDTALECARQLHEEFRRTLETGCAGVVKETPTLSVGLAIGHYLEPLENLLEYARGAEKAAKGTERDGLAVHYHPRSGAPVCIEGRWKHHFYQRLDALTVLHRDGLIGDKAAYDLRELSRLYRGWDEDDNLAVLLQADVTRLLQRKPGTGMLLEVHGLEEILKTAKNAAAVQRLAEEIIVARLFGKARKTSGWNPLLLEEAAA